MKERTILFPFCFPGTLNADKTMYLELPYVWTLLGIKGGASNATPARVSATLVSTSVVTAAAIGSSGDMNYIQPTAPVAVDANELVTITLDYDGTSGTASADVTVIVVGTVGD
jgi:hypothetical protein